LIAFCCTGLGDFLNATVSEESSAYILKDSLASIFDSNSDFWTRAPWVKKEDIRRVFHHMLSEDSKQLDGEEVGTLNLALHRTERTVSVKSSYANMNAVELRQEKPMFMNTEPLMQMHVDRPEQTGSSARFVYYDSEITSIIRYAHCSGKFQNYTLDIVKRELFPVSSNAAILDEVAPVNVGFEWETIGELLLRDTGSFVFSHARAGATRMGTTYTNPLQEEACKEFARILLNSEHRDIVSIEKTFSQRFPDVRIPEEKLTTQMQTIQNSPVIVAKWECSEKNTTYVVKSFFPFLFKKLRSIYCLQEGSSTPESDFFDSIARCAPLKTSGGKSRVSFFKTHGETYVVKELQGVESALFMSEGQKFIDYMTDKLTKEEPCALAKIVGFFQVQVSQGGKSFSQDIIVMENLLAGIDTHVNMVFDLKGSDNKKRYVEFSEPGQVLHVARQTSHTTQPHVFRPSHPYTRCCKTAISWKRC
jgi:hypothetical protein